MHLWCKSGRKKGLYRWTFEQTQNVWSCQKSMRIRTQNRARIIENLCKKNNKNQMKICGKLQCKNPVLRKKTGHVLNFFNFCFCDNKMGYALWRASDRFWRESRFCVCFCGFEILSQQSVATFQRQSRTMQK